ncbi:monocarboxylate transporter 12-like [Schistocerca serialis cubense]|uniref:monocarboxylate transporter 12-like n=1 Tax=Schistocerca serialis cubense TaxID=2023355 RepID=UPI00214EB61B|nr:monocarboxylate transporter 12-like [Schistocerca serialis cubense]
MIPEPSSHVARGQAAETVHPGAFLAVRAGKNRHASPSSGRHDTFKCQRSCHHHLAQQQQQQQQQQLARRSSGQACGSAGAPPRQHYYPEGGWGWIVCAAGFLAHLLSCGLQLAFGLLLLYTVRHLGDNAVIDSAWLGALSTSSWLLAAPLAVSLCRRKWTRLTAMLAGLVMALACLFASFATQLHQLLLSYGVLLGMSSGLVRETASLTLGHYFRRRREFVEMVVQAGAGVGIALFSVLYREAVGQWGWRLGLQAVTVLLCGAFFLGMLYRSASMYHPQRRAILLLKSQRKKARHKKPPSPQQRRLQQQPRPPFFDVTPLRIRAVQVLMLSSAVSALGVYTPVFYLALQGYQEGLDDSALVLLQTFLGFATALGCVGFGLMVVRASDQCLVSRQYLCQAAMAGIGLSLLALSTVQGYHGYVLVVWLYGVCLGGFFYSLKVFTMQSVRSRYFARAWGFVQGAEALPLLLGVPITGYINQSHPKAGYYFSLLATLLGAVLLFLVGGGSGGGNGGAGACSDWEDGPPPLPLPPPVSTPATVCGRPRLHKSISFATPLDLPMTDEYWRPVRPCRSVPEGLGRHQPITVVEQITTSV